MQPVPYLFFNGTCEEAIRAYARVFGSPEPEVMHAKDAPEGETSGIPNAIMHASLKVGDGWLYASDFSKAERMAGSSIIVTQKTAEESRRIFDALAEGGEVEMPFEATFWSPAFGALTDRFGTRWMIDTESQGAAQGSSQTAEAVA